MGLKELNHLKDTLSKIKEKNAKISENEDKLIQLGNKKSDEILKIGELELSIGKKNKRIKPLEKKASNAKAPSKEEDKELKELEDELVDFEDKLEKFRQKEEERSAKKFSGAVILFFLLLFGSAILVGVIEDIDAIIVGEENSYQCDNGKKIPAHWVNDGVDQCGDNSDEDVEVTEELSQAMRNSDRRNSFFIVGCCCVFLFTFIWPIAISVKSADIVFFEESRVAELQERKETLQKKKTTYNLTKSAPTRMKQEIEKAENHLGGAKSRVNKFENDIQHTKSEIARLKGEIDEHYESIKHLIPFSDKIDE